MKNSYYFYTTFGLLILLGLIISGYIFGWTVPSTTPPGGNLAAPINTGSTNQAKTGYLAVGTSTTPTYPLEVGNQLRVWGQLISKVASGTAPFVIDSPTKVTNLNVDLLDGYDSSDLLGGSSQPDIIGNLYISTTFPGIKRVFITSTSYNGNLGGASGADSKCQTAANNGNLGGTWKAFVLTSDSSRNSYNKIFTNPTGIYVHVKPITIGIKDYYEVFVWDVRTLVGNTSSGAWAGGIWGSWRVYNEFKIDTWPYTWGSYFWSGSNGQGEVVSGYTCDDWVAGANLNYGRSGAFRCGGYYNDLFGPTSAACNANYPLLCVEQ